VPNWDEANNEANADGTELALGGWSKHKRQSGGGDPQFTPSSPLQKMDKVELMATEITALGEREILALAIGLEEEDVRIYRDLAEKVRAQLPGLASILDSMRE
jgi:hypothetical protein